jgi:aryl-alcohol dehydrogenase-like predicted oxidoreductase
VWDFYTPVEETLRVLDGFVRSGKIRYIGVSNWEGWHVVKTNACARSANLTPVISNQIYYNIADRVAENSIIPACRDQNVGIIVWGALGHGFLAGGYKRGDEHPAKDSRLHGDVMKAGESTSWDYLANEKSWTILEQLARLAKRPGRTVATVAIRWLLQHGCCDVVLLGGEKPEYYEDALNLLNFRLTEDEMQELTKISEPDPVYPTNFYKLFCHRNSKFWGGLR